MSPIRCVCFDREVSIAAALLTSLTLTASPSPSRPYAASPTALGVSTRATHDAPRTDDERAIRWMRLGGMAAAVGAGAGLVSTAMLQARELKLADQCLAAGGASPDDPFHCFGQPTSGVAAVRSLGLAAAVGGGFASGYLFGRARGRLDAAAGHTRVRNGHALGIFTAVFVVSSANVLLLSNVAGIANERKCETHECVDSSRRRRYLATDLSTAGLSLSLALGGHTVGRLVELRRHRSLSVLPSAHAAGGSVAVSGRF